MLPKKVQQGNLFFVRYFFFYATFLAYFLLSGCFGIRKELIPKRNATLGNISEKAQEDYLELQQELNTPEKEQLEGEVNSINNPATLERFIEIRTTYKKLLELLPRSERTLFKEKFDEAANIADIDQQLDAQQKLIDQSSGVLQMIQDAAIPTQQYYIVLLEILPDNKAVALKNKIANATSADEVDHLITSELPKSFKQLDTNRQATFLKLPPREQQAALKSFMQQEAKEAFASQKEQLNEVKPNHKPTDPNRSNDDHSTTSANQLDLNKLIDQAGKAQQEQAKNIPQDQDEWGSKLPLEGEPRKQFRICVMQLELYAQKDLKELFDQTEPDSLKNFFSVFFEFIQKDRIDLLGTIIVIYRADPSLALKLCNQPKSLILWDKYHIGKILAFGDGVRLLKQLDTSLSNKPK